MSSIIELLEITTEESWCTDVVKTSSGQSCLFGHLFDIGGTRLMDDFENIANTYMVYPVNDGLSPKYIQETPKQRVLAYLRDIRDGKEKTTYELLDEYMELTKNREQGTER